MNVIEWIDGAKVVRTLTQAEIDARTPDPAEQLAEWRSTADMDKGAFCIGLMRAKVLPPQEAEAAAKGEWPATFATAVSTLPIDPSEAKIIWSTTARVRRLHPILLALIPQSPLTDADVDAMFGWVV